MKIQIRRSIFETNSSSVHSITMDYFEYNTFAKSYITNNGEEVVAFGFYGYN